MRIFAISDIHGCLKTFKALLRQLNLRFEDQIVLVGDYVDRGPDSKGVIDYILELQKNGFNIIPLRGNHEEMMIKGLRNSEARFDWLRNGGTETADSYLVNDKITIPNTHLQFLEDLPYFRYTDQFIFVHAGLNMKLLEPLEDKHSMLWIRGWYERIDRQWLGNRIIVHGHTPMPKVKIEFSLKNLDRLPVINIDAGCVFKEARGLGHLCAVELTAMKLYFQPNIEGS